MKRIGGNFGPFQSRREKISYDGVSMTVTEDEEEEKNQTYERRFPDDEEGTVSSFPFEASVKNDREEGKGDESNSDRPEERHRRSFWSSSFRRYGLEDDAVEGIRSRIPDRSSLVDEKEDREEGKGDEIMLCRSDERHHRSSSSSSSASSYGGCMEYDTYEERAVLRNIAEDVDSLVRRYALTEEEKKEGETKKGIKQKQLRSRDDDWIGTRSTDRGRDPPDVFTGSVEDVTGTTGTDGYPSIRHSGVQVDIPRDDPVEDLDTGVTDGGYGSNRAGTDHRILLIRGRIGRAQNVPVAGLTGVFDNVRVEVRLLRSSY